MPLHRAASGFRPSKDTTHADTGELLSICLTRKNNPHDLVLAQGARPRLHHVAFIVSDLQAIFRACDIAANDGYGRNVEHGPGRHEPPNGIFVYFRDPDGNRIEFGLPPMQRPLADSFMRMGPIPSLPARTPGRAWSCQGRARRRARRSRSSRS